MKNRSHKTIALLTGVIIALGIILTPAGSSNAADTILIDDTVFPDPVFMEYVKDNLDPNKDGKLAPSEIADIKEIQLEKKEINTIEGIEVFTELTRLDFHSTNVTTVDLSKNLKLTTLYCSSNKMETLDVSKNTALWSINCSKNAITTLILGDLPNLHYLRCSDNKISVLALGGLPALTDLYCSNNELTKLDFKNNTKLTAIFCDKNKIESLDVSMCQSLNYISCNYNKVLATLNLGEITRINRIFCRDNCLTSLDVSRCTKMDQLYCGRNKLTSLDISNCEALDYLECNHNQITSLDTSNNTKLTSINFFKNQITTLDTSNNPLLSSITCAENPLTSLTLGKKPDLDFLCAYNTDLKVLNIEDCPKLNDAFHKGEKTLNSEPYFSDVDPLTDCNFFLYQYTFPIEGTEWNDFYRLLVDYDTELIVGKASTPTPKPTSAPTATPTSRPTSAPTSAPTAKPTSAPTSRPTAVPTTKPAKPTVKPTGKPTDKPDATVTPVTEPKAAILEFVERIYIYVLDREPEADGAAFWSDELYSFRRTGAEVAQGFIFSPEFESRGTTDTEFVTILYKTFFGRDPEADGMSFWLSQLSSGNMDRVAVANGFIYSQEWADTCASYGIRSGGNIVPQCVIAPTDLTYAFVERMYTTCMGRGYDEEGRQYWASELANFKVTGETCGASFFLSDEMASYGLSDEEFLNRLYLTFMDRESDADGATYWLGVMASGTPRADVVFGFTRSPEFTEKCIEARILPY